MFKGYTVTMTAAQGGRHPHKRSVYVEFADLRDVVRVAWEERYGTVLDLARIVPRDNPGAYSVLLNGGGVTFVEVERI